MVAKSPIFRLQKLLGRSVDKYSVLFNNEREPHPLSTETGKQSLTWGGEGVGAVPQKKTGLYHRGCFCKKSALSNVFKKFLLIEYVSKKMVPKME